MIIFTLEIIALVAAVIFVLLSAATFGSRNHQLSGVWLFLTVVAIGVFFISDLSKIWEARDFMTALAVSGKLIGIYIACGLVTGVAYFWSYSRNARDVFETKVAARDLTLVKKRLAELFLNLKVQLVWANSGGTRFDRDAILQLPEVQEFIHKFQHDDDVVKAYIRWKVLTEEHSLIFDDPFGDLKIQHSIKESQEKVSTNITNDFDGATLLVDEIKKVLPPRYSDCKKFIVWSAIEWPVTIIWLFYKRFLRQVVEILFNKLRALFDVVSKLAFGEIKV